MAIQTSTLTVVGKVGNLVGRKGYDGKQLISIYQPVVSDPKTPAQIEQRAKVALAAKVASMLGVVGRQALVANGSPANRYGRLVRQILAMLSDGEGFSTPSLLAALPLIKTPGGDITYSNKAFTYTPPTTVASGSIAYTFKGTLNEGDSLIRYCVALLLYNSTKDQWRSQSWVLDSDGSVRIYVGSDWKDNTVIAYAYVLGVLTNGNNTILPSASLGSLIGDQTQFQQVVDSENVLYGRYNYVQVDYMTHSANLSSN